MIVYFYEVSWNYKYPILKPIDKTVNAVGTSLSCWAYNIKNNRSYMKNEMYKLELLSFIEKPGTLQKNPWNQKKATWKNLPIY